ncbi:MAG: leucine-rich repeat domain-containing protein [Planctomyces sp.]|nr:leucine-rich repeat domain-containing protein [Planctomyces sp.]
MKLQLLNRISFPQSSRIRVALLSAVLAGLGCEQLGIKPEGDGSAPADATAEAGSDPNATDAAANAPVFTPEQAKPMSEDPGVAGSAANAAAVTPEQFLANFRAKATREINDADLATLSGMTELHPQITELSLKGSPISRNGLATLASFPALRTVDLTGSTIQGDDWTALATATQIESLNLESAGISDASLAAVAPLVNLKYLNLNRTQISDQAFIHFMKLSNLEEIHIENTRLTGAGFEAFGRQGAKSPLKKIYAGNTKFGQFGFVHIKGIDSLEVLGAANSDVTDSCLVALKGMDKLRSLHLGSNQISDQGLTVLAGLKKLEELDISGSRNVSNASLNRIRKHEGLTMIDVDDTSCNQQGVEEMKKLHPNCRIFFGGATY